ncbi:MAG: hypothetical protein D5S01_04575 [Halanaerobium sp. MSAO_Bac5]|nr:MAG: hypothetical protein D5S01_04575 [Halanaerobium sp. MSAO_Bac5]
MKKLNENQNKGIKILKIIAMLFVFTLGITLASVSIEIVQDLIRNPTIDIKEYNWEEYQVKNLILEKPDEYNLKKVDPQTPKELKPYTVDHTVYEFEGENLFFTINTLKYSDVVDINLEKGYVEMLSGMENQGAEIINSKEDKVFISNKNAIRYKLDYNIYNYNYIQKGINIIDSQRIYMIGLTYEKDFKSFNKVAEKILDSIKIE